VRTRRIDLELPSAEALALAQFVKRVTWAEMRACAVDELSVTKSAQRSTKYSERWPPLTTRRGKQTLLR
jgi:hypothetical protein